MLREILSSPSAKVRSRPETAFCLTFTLLHFQGIQYGRCREDNLPRSVISFTLRVLSRDEHIAPAGVHGLLFPDRIVFTTKLPVYAADVNYCLCTAMAMICRMSCTPPAILKTSQRPCNCARFR